MNCILFRGNSYRAKKGYFKGTHRIVSPEETWEKIAPLASQIGVSRVANVTGLDRIGIPVTAVIRPEALTLSTSSGKGLDLCTSLVSGLMESLELHCAEEADLSYLHLPYHELSKRVKTIPIDRLPLRKNSLFRPDWPERWTIGWDLFNQEEVAVPLLSVIHNYKIVRQEPSELHSFEMTSNGLASGNHFLEALAAGIYELIERDAITCHMFAFETVKAPLPRVRLETIRFSKVQQVIEQLKWARFQLLLYDCTIDTEVPVFMATLYDQTMRHTRLSQGYGAHLEPEVAMIRAITEAVQGSTIGIAGSRDDIFFSQLKQGKQSDSEQTITALENQPATVDVSQLESVATSTLEEDVTLLMEKIRNVGITQLLVFDLSKEDLGVSVLRVIAPGLEGYFSHVVSAQRAKIFAEKQKPHARESLLSLKQSLHLPAGGI
ncbi:MAG: YcaO-like family protein [Simkania sp.]|nr:YcaO-like family protein [Simkania sp.]MCP5490216.1 YcaO-like family protein [Chlamydiales bacterium]